MKHKGSTSDFIPQRDRELMSCFRDILATSRGIPLREMFGMAAKRPCSRFWVAEERAAEVVSAMLRGADTDKFLPQKKRMYQEICRRVEKYMSEHPGATMTRAVSDVVNNEAPEFFLTDKSAMVIIYRLKRKSSRSPGKSGKSQSNL